MAAVLSEDDHQAAPRTEPAEELFIVLNLRSGKDEKGGVRAALERELQAAGRAHSFVPVEPGQIVRTCQQAARLAQDKGGILVAVGGDGTLNAAAQAAHTHDVPLGVIAQGTFNLFARVHGLPRDPADAMRSVLQGTPEDVQVGWVNQRVFLVNAAVGFYPKLLADREVAKQKLGRRRWIALLAGLKSLFEWRLQLALDVDLDGQVKRLRTPTLFVCNNRLQLTRIGIEEDIVDQVGEGRLAGVMSHSLGAWDKLRLIWRAIVGKLGEDREVSSFLLRSLTVGARNAKRLRVSTDGEVQWMQLPLRFAVAPRPLRVVMPPEPMKVPVE